MPPISAFRTASCAEKPERPQIQKFFPLCSLRSLRPSRSLRPIDPAQRRGMGSPPMNRPSVPTLLTLAAIVVLGVVVRSYQISAPYFADFHSYRQGDSAAFVHGYLVDSI